MMRKDQDAVPLTDERETMKEDGMDENIELNEGAQIARRAAEQWLREGELIPLSHLVLDHPEPVGGWEPLLQARGIELLSDDLYRPAIRREDARALVEERREWERSSVEKARQLQESLEGLSVPAGVPAVEGATPMASIMANDPGYQTVAEEFGRPKPTFLDDMLAEGRRADAAARAETAAQEGG
jgi:hypothetical protein